MCNDSIYSTETPSNNHHSEEKRFYVYVYFDPYTKEPFYVGKGTGNRAWVHIKSPSNPRDTNKLKKRKIEKILKSGSTPIVKIIKDGLTEFEAYRDEASLIAHYGRLWNHTGCLVNIEEGWGRIGTTRGFRDKNLYTIRNIETSEIMEMTMDDMVEFLNTDPNNVRGLVNGRSLNCLGWCLNSTTDEELKMPLKDKKSYRIKNVMNGEEKSLTQSEMVNILGFSPSNSSMLVNGVCRQSNGWCMSENYGMLGRTTLVGVSHWFNNPSMNIVEYSTQKDLCDKYGLIPSCVSMVVSGKLDSSGGWFCGKEFSKKYIPKSEKQYKLIHYLGEVVYGDEIFLKRFLKSNKTKMLLNGQRRHIGGWFLDYISEEKLKGFRIDGTDPFIHIFKNIKSGEVVKSTKMEFCSLYNIPITKLEKLFKGGVYKREWVLHSHRLGYTIPK